MVPAPNVTSLLNDNVLPDPVIVAVPEPLHVPEPTRFCIPAVCRLNVEFATLTVPLLVTLEPLNSTVDDALPPLMVPLIAGELSISSVIELSILRFAFTGNEKPDVAVRFD